MTPKEIAKKARALRRLPISEYMQIISGSLTLLEALANAVARINSSHVKETTRMDKYGYEDKSHSPLMRAAVAAYGWWGTLSGASIGATLGTVLFPGAGTVFGYAAGTVVGLASGAAVGYFAHDLPKSLT